MMTTVMKQVLSLSLATALLLSGCASAVSDESLNALSVDPSSLCEKTQNLVDYELQCPTFGSLGDSSSSVVKDKICPVPNLGSFTTEFEPITIELVADEDWEYPQKLAIPVPMLAEVEHSPDCDWPIGQTPYPGMVVTISGENCKESSIDYYDWRLSGRGLSVIEDRIDNESLYDVATVYCPDGKPQSFIMGPAAYSSGGDLSWSTYPPTNTLDSSYLSLRGSLWDLRILESSTWDITFKPLSALPSLELGKIYSPYSEEGWVGSGTEFSRSASFFRYYLDDPEPLKVRVSKPDEKSSVTIKVLSDENPYFGIHRQFENLDINTQTAEVFFRPGWNLIQVSSKDESERIIFEPTE
jgi:hypothetical protein